MGCSEPLVLWSIASVHQHSQVSSPSGDTGRPYLPALVKLSVAVQHFWPIKYEKQHVSNIWVEALKRMILPSYPSLLQ